MRIIPLSVTILITLILIVVFNTKLLLPAPLGQLLSPQHGVWQNAEPTGKNFSEELKFQALKGKANVYFDERLVPHVFAEQEADTGSRRFFYPGIPACQIQVMADGISNACCSWQAFRNIWRENG
jgi:hypothetical protein